MEIIFPPKCGICGKLDEKYLCRKCEKLLEKELVNKEGFCIQDIRVFNENISFIHFFKYQGLIRKIILDYKFNEKAYLYRTIISILLKNKKIFEFLKSYDTIIAVPISKQRKKERGYNQSLLIAKEISKISKIPIQNKCLYKIKNNSKQSTLSKDEREKNVQGVYELKNSKLIRNKSILIIDDIYTTGSTIKECYKILKQENIKKIGVLTIAKD